MLIIFDRTIDPNILSVDTGNVEDADILWWNSETTHSWTIDKFRFKIRVGADDATISFKNFDGMQPYLDQYSILFPQRTVPSIEKIIDPYGDLPQTGKTIDHTYTYTDVERDLIK